MIGLALMSLAARAAAAWLAAVLCWTTIEGAAAGSPQSSTSRVSAAAALISEARALAARNQLDAAKGKCQQALELDPNSATAHDLLGFVLGLQGRTSDAIAEFDRAVTLQPKLFDAQYHLGATLWWTRQLDRARAALGRAVSLRPSHAEARYYLGVTERQLGDVEAAIADLRTAVRLD